jgi:eukaryotic-like serine/threonine-protein kinase
MGDVYRARDTRLGREVAIKVLGDRGHDRPEYVARFEREARAVAELSHPNIAALHDVGRHEEIEFLVLELVGGETLAARLMKGPLPIEAVCRLGAQIASALAAAHARGIVHRDLKPSNIMLTPDGVKLLDFGLARRFELGPGDTAAVDLTGEFTATGTILGTVPYMAPEQIEGGPIDARTDLFALGSVLWEMATGRRAFDAPTDPARMAAILGAEPPPIASVRPGTPPALDRLVRECLRKDPARRWQSSWDAALVLESLAGDPAASPALGGPKRRPWLQWATLAAAATAVLLWAWQATTPSGGPPTGVESVRFTLEPPDGGGFAYYAETNFLSVSPDGRRIAYTAYDADGTRIWLRDLGSVTAQPLRGTEGAAGHAWSPDGRSLAFFVGGRIQRLDLPDGTPVTLAETASRSGHYLSWGTNESILFGRVQGDTIFRVSAGGGAPEAVVVSDTTRGVNRVGFPKWLPDGERFLYLVRGAGDDGALMLASATGAADTIMLAESMVEYAEPGVLAFVRDGVLMAQRFDPRRGRVSGSPVAVADGVRYFLSTGVGSFATSAGATLVYQTGGDRQRLAWFDRSGLETGGVGIEADYVGLAISPDGKQLLIDRADPRITTRDVLLFDLERGVASPITTSRFTEAFGTWVPGQDFVLYSISRGGPPYMVRRDLGSGTETRLLRRGGFQQPTSVSADGQTVLFSLREAGGSFEIWSVRLDGEGSPSPLVQTSGDDVDGRFSRDGRWVAFLSNESGRSELYLTPFPGPGARVRVSPDGARAVRWSHATGELIWLTPDRRVVVARVQTDPLRIEATTTLFTLPPGMVWTNFDLTPDGQRLLAVIPVSVANVQPVTVVTNWTAQPILSAPTRR